MTRIACCALVLALTAAARADEGGSRSQAILVLATSPTGDGFVEALRIQLRERAEILRGPSIEGETLTVKMQRATEAARHRGATIATWFESTDTPGTAALYVVAPERQRALVEIVHVENQPEPDTERALALKVGEVFDQIAAQNAAASLSPPSTPPARRPSFEFAISLDAVGSHTFRSAGAQLDGQLTFGIATRLNGGAQRADLYVGARLPGRVARTTEHGTVEAHITEIVVGCGASFMRGPWGIGWKTEGSFGVLSAEGRTPVGNTGKDALLLARLGLALRGGVWLTPRLQLHAAVGPELQFPRRRLLVNDVPLMDFGHLRSVASLGIEGVFP